MHTKGDWQLIVWPDSSQKSLLHLKKRGCKGAFVSIQTTAKAKELLPVGIPMIAVSTLQDTASIPFISANPEEIAQMASEYFLKRKFKNFAFFGLTQAKWSRERMDHFFNYLAKTGYNADIFKEKQIPVTNDSIPFAKLWVNTAFDTGQEELTKWLRRLPKPTAILASCDIFACHLINVAKEAGLNVPDEIAILGVNNDQAICNTCDPPLSSIAFNFKRVGYDAAKLLDKLIAGRETMQGQRIDIQPTHIENRGSTDVFAIDDVDIVQALKYIRQNSNKSLQVNEIANQVYTSKRSLQLKFHKAVGRSIHEEIIRAHFENAKTMLIETDLPIDEIAGRSGFLYTSNMRRAFKQFAGMLPQKYRRMYRTQ